MHFQYMLWLRAVIYHITEFEAKYMESFRIIFLHISYPYIHTNILSALQISFIQFSSQFSSSYFILKILEFSMEIYIIKTICRCSLKWEKSKNFNERTRMKSSHCKTREQSKEPRTLLVKQEPYPCMSSKMEERVFCISILHLLNCTANIGRQ